MSKLSDVFIQFKLEAQYDRNRVEITMVESTKPVGSKWASTRIVGRATVKIYGFWYTEGSLGFRLSEKQREMLAKYKKNLKYYDAIDEYIRIAELPKISVVDSKLTDFINKLR